MYGINRLRETLVVAESTRRSMKGNKSRDTKPEIALRKGLWSAGLRGYRKNVRKLPGTPDVVFGRAKLAIFVHGCFWHGHECGRARVPTQNRAFWAEKIRLNQERHAAHESALLSKGYAVLTFWECELRREQEALINRVAGILRERRQDKP